MTVTFVPSRATTAILIHTGDLRSNLANAGTPTQFADVQDTVQVGTVPNATVQPTAGPYVPPDGGVVVAAGYDELYVDVRPVVRADGSVGVATPTTQSAFRQIGMTDCPYWLIVRTDGYGVAAANRQQALTAALNVVTWLRGQALSLLMTQRLRGFAFVSPDLNVRFPDGSVIDRIFQNQLVQACWTLGGACTFITSRPADITTIVGPLLSTDPQHIDSNAGQPLPWSILGDNPAYRDRVVIAYPAVQNVGQSPGVILGMIAGTLGARGRDAGFPLNLDTALVVPIDESAYGPDGVIGTVDPVDWLARIGAFATALGVTTLGIVTTNTILPVERYLPPDAGVNATGAVRASSTAGVVTVMYADATGATSEIVRRFDHTVREISTT